MLRILAVLTLLITAFAASGEVSHACGCVDETPMSESALSALKERAERGDILATGTIWFEYRDIRRNPTLERQWRFRAIRAGDPRVTRRRGGHWMSYAAETANDDHKRIFIEAAVALLEKGYPNRHLLETSQYGGVSEQTFYLMELRRARAAKAVLRDGIRYWSRRAQRNDADAAFHVATYFSLIEPDQQNRALWIARASSLGDPHYSQQFTTPSPLAMQ